MDNDWTFARSEMEAIGRRFAAGGYTADEFCAAIREAVARHSARTEVVSTLPNGICKMRALDARGKTIAEWHEAPGK